LPNHEDIKSVEFVHRESEKLRQVDDGIIRRVKVVERFSQVQDRPFHSDEVAEGEESTKGALSSRLVIEKTKDFFQSRFHSQFFFCKIVIRILSNQQPHASQLSPDSRTASKYKRHARSPCLDR